MALTIEKNGLLCTPDIAKEIAKSPIRFVSVSIYPSWFLVRWEPTGWKRCDAEIRRWMSFDQKCRISWPECAADVWWNSDVKARALSKTIIEPEVSGHPTGFVIRQKKWVCSLRHLLGLKWSPESFTDNLEILQIIYSFKYLQLILWLWPFT